MSVRQNKPRSRPVVAVVAAIGIFVVTAIVGFMLASGPSASADAAQTIARLTVNLGQVNTGDCIKLVQDEFGMKGHPNEAVVHKTVPGQKATSKIVKIVVSVPVGSGKTVQTPAFIVGAQSPNKIAVLGMNVKLVPQTVEAEMATICRDPLQAAQVVAGLGMVKVDGISLAASNPWMQPMLGTDNAHTWAENCWKQGADVSTHLACARQMAGIASLLSLLHPAGIHRASSAWQFHLTGYSVSDVPTFGTDSTREHNAPFLIFQITDKTEGCVEEFGFDVGITSITGGDDAMAGLPCTTSPSSKPGSPATPVPGHPAPPRPRRTPPPIPKSPPSPPTKSSSPPTHPSTPPTSHSTPPSTPTPTPTPSSSTPTTTPTPTPSTSTPTPTCESAYGPGYSGTYPDCHKDGTSVPPPPTQAPGPNPSPNPTGDPGSNQCYGPDGNPASCPPTD